MNRQKHDPDPSKDEQDRENQKMESETDDVQFADWAAILFDQALLAEGAQLEDPAGFVNKLNKLMLKMS